MKSIYDLEFQNQDVESRVVVALEKLSEAFRSALWLENKKNGLSPIQIRILIFLRWHRPELLSVRALAEEFNMTPATISDSVRVLEQKGLLTKKSIPGDARGKRLELTRQGVREALQASYYANDILEQVGALGKERSREMLDMLLEIIGRLHDRGLIAMNRMCLNCGYLENKGEQKYYCRLVQKELRKGDLRLDCPEHEAAEGLE